MNANNDYKFVLGAEALIPEACTAFDDVREQNATSPQQAGMVDTRHSAVPEFDPYAIWNFDLK